MLVAFHDLNGRYNARIAESTRTEAGSTQREIVARATSSCRVGGFFAASRESKPNHVARTRPTKMSRVWMSRSFSRRTKRNYWKRSRPLWNESKPAITDFANYVAGRFPKSALMHCRKPRHAFNAPAGSRDNRAVRSDGILLVTRFLKRTRQSCKGLQVVLAAAVEGRVRSREPIWFFQLAE